MRKVLVSLLVVAMVLGLVGTSFAYTDTTNNKYIDKTSAFGWMNGYPDGTFKPTGNITRAEAAAVVVRALGLSAAADAAKGLASKFSDVPSTHWASGFVNVCTTKGILKGYPDGTFKPEANVSNAEIITMIVRALNRESQAVGEWPIGHITVAAAENIIGSGFISNALASREAVATYVAKASDVNLLKLTTNGWEEDATKTMAKQNDLTLLEDRKVDGYDTAAKSITLKDVSVTPNVSKTYDLTTNYVISEGKALRDLLGYTVDAYVNDDTDVVYVEVVTASTSKNGVIKSTGGSGTVASPYFFYLDGDTKKYEVSTTATLFRNGVAAAFTTFIVDDTVDFYMESNVVTYAKATRNDVTDAVVESVRATGDISSQYIRYDRRGTVATKYMDEETTVTIDGVKKTLADVKEHMVANIQLDPNDTNVALAITVSTKTVTGKVTAKRGYTDPAGDNYWYVSIDGVEYRVGGSARIFDAAFTGAAPNWGTDVVYNAITVGDTITAYLAPNGRINQADIATGTAQYGKITGITLGGEYDKWTVDVKGSNVVYELDDSTPPGFAATAKVGDFITLKKNTAGRLIGGVGGTALALPLVTPVAPAVGALVTDVASGDKLIQVGGATWLSVGDSSVIYVDNEYGTVGAISKDSRIRYYVASGMKISFAVVDTISKIDSGLITAKAGLVIDGQEDSVENSSTIEIYATAAGATTQVGAIAPASVATGTLAGTVITATNVGAFNFTLTAAPAGGNAYLRITDPMGVWTVLSVKVAP